VLLTISPNFVDAVVAQDSESFLFFWEILVTNETSTTITVEVKDFNTGTVKGSRDLDLDEIVGLSFDGNSSDITGDPNTLYSINIAVGEVPAFSYLYLHCDPSLSPPSSIMRYNKMLWIGVLEGVS